MMSGDATPKGTRDPETNSYCNAPENGWVGRRSFPCLLTASGITFLEVDLDGTDKIQRAWKLDKGLRYIDTLSI